MPESPRNSFAGQVSTLLGRVSLNPRGEYAGGQTYDRLDIVQYNGSGWICLKNGTTDVTPVEGDNWMRFADNGGAATVEAAQEYANQAKASQTAAGESATAAEQSASDAEIAKTGAETALASAETAKEDAASSATEAAGSATEAAESARSAKDYSGKPPVIDEETGNWKTWDAESGGYTDTGKPSRGEKGERGEQGPPGKDGTGTGDMMAADYDPTGKKQDIFAYVDNAVENVKLPDNLITGEEEELPPVELALNADTFGGFGPEHYATEESVEKKADQSALTDGLAEKQDKITGTSGQIVGFDENGNAIAQEAPAGGITQKEADARYLQLTGGTMSGNIDMGNHKVSGLATPTVATDAATKDYVDSKANKFPVEYTETSFYEKTDVRIITRGKPGDIGTKLLQITPSNTITLEGLVIVGTNNYYILPLHLANYTSPAVTINFNKPVLVFSKSSSDSNYSYATTSSIIIDRQSVAVVLEVPFV